MNRSICAKEQVFLQPFPLTQAVGYLLPVRGRPLSLSDLQN